MHFVYFLCKSLIEVFFKKSHKFYTFCTLLQKKPVKSRISGNMDFLFYQVYQEISGAKTERMGVAVGNE